MPRKKIEDDDCWGRFQSPLVRTSFLLPEKLHDEMRKRSYEWTSDYHEYISVGEVMRMLLARAVEEEDSSGK